MISGGFVYCARCSFNVSYLSGSERMFVWYIDSVCLGIMYIFNLVSSLGCVIFLSAFAYLVGGGSAQSFLYHK